MSDAAFDAIDHFFRLRRTSAAPKSVAPNTASKGFSLANLLSNVTTAFSTVGSD